LLDIRMYASATRQRDTYLMELQNNVDMEKLADELYDRLSERMAKSSKYNRTDKGTGNTELGKIIRSYRGTESLREVGSATGLHHGFIGRLERGDRGASVETLARLAGHFGDDFALDYLVAVLRLTDPNGDRPSILANQPTIEGGPLDQAGDEGGYDAPSSTVYRAGFDAVANAIRSYNMDTEQKYEVHR
jgi:transcriptional regulator with XRE-family HTH domain